MFEGTGGASVVLEIWIRRTLTCTRWAGLACPEEELLAGSINDTEGAWGDGQKQAEKHVGRRHQHKVPVSGRVRLRGGKREQGGGACEINLLLCVLAGCDLDVKGENLDVKGEKNDLKLTSRVPLISLRRGVRAEVGAEVWQEVEQQERDLGAVR